MKITTLIENHTNDATPDLTAEHGLSLHIEHGGLSILFDTGATGAFSDNADQLGVDLSAVDLLVLSHHHYDHGGGLETFFSTNTHAKVYLRSADVGEPHVRAFGLIRRYIGLDETIFEHYADRFVFIDEVKIMKTVIPDADFFHKLKSGIHFIPGSLVGIRCTIPW